MICPNCGKQIGDASKFCRFCGKSFAAAPQENNAPLIPPPVYPQSSPVQPQVTSPAGTNEAGNVKPDFPSDTAPQQFVPVGEFAPVTAAKPKKSKKGLIAIPVAAAVLAGGGFGGWKLLGSSDKDSSAVTTVSPGNDDDTSTSTDEALTELTGYVSELRTLTNDTYNEVNSILDEDDSDECWTRCTDLLSDYLDECESMQKKADKIDDLDKKVRDAAKQYFSMCYTSSDTMREMYSFVNDYSVFYNDQIAERPNPEDYSSDSKFISDYEEWILSVDDSIKTIDSVPPCLETEWSKYESSVSLDVAMFQNYKAALRNEDILRIFSACCLEERHKVIDGNLYDKIFDVLDEEGEHSGKQRSAALKLAKEIGKYSDLSAEERADYKFENTSQNEILCEIEAVDTIYPSLYNTYDAFAIVKVGTLSGTRDVVIEAEIEGFTQKYRDSVKIDPYYKTVYIKPPALSGDIDLSSAKPAQLTVSIYENDGSALIQAKTFSVTIKSRNDFEWYSDEYGYATQDNILCFLTPESSEITKLKRLAIDEISAMTSGKLEALAGYQSTGWNNYTTTYLQVAGLMRAMYETGVRYNMDPFSISGSSQRILLPNEVLAQKSGLCIETSLVMASALQSANMHAFLVFPPGHAQVAVEIWDSGEGAGEYFLIETTALSSSSNNRDIFIDGANALIKGKKNECKGTITYMSSSEWEDYLSEVTYIIDCDNSVALGLTPFSN